MGTKNNPGKFDCYAKAEPDEPMFILLGRDPAAAHTIRAWCKNRIQYGQNSVTDAKIIEALKCAEEMQQYAVEREKERNEGRTT